MRGIEVDAVTEPTPRRLRIKVHCDREGCISLITVNHDITEEQAAAAAMALGWQCERGTARWSHHCPRHSESP
jgi:hypothetical protein